MGQADKMDGRADGRRARCGRHRRRQKCAQLEMGGVFFVLFFFLLRTRRRRDSRLRVSLVETRKVAVRG